MAKIDTWLKNVNPVLAKSMTPVTGVDFLHISSDHNIKTMIPRVGNRQMGTEDRSITRISGASTIMDCIYGHSGICNMIFEEEHFDGNVMVERKPVIITIYRCNVEELIRPSRKLVPDVTKTKELWIVPHTPQTCNVKPETVGKMLAVKSTRTVELGEVLHYHTFYVYVSTAVVLYNKPLEAGYHSFTVAGDLSPNMRRIPFNVSSITKKAWTEAYSKLIGN